MMATWTPSFRALLRVSARAPKEARASRHEGAFRSAAEGARREVRGRRFSRSRQSQPQTSRAN